MSPRDRRLSVLLTTEGTYPYHGGGVSTWCHALTSKLTDVDFTILALTMHPYLERAYSLSPNVRDLVTVPLWGTEDPAEYGRYASAAEFLRSRWRTTSEGVARDFVPIYEAFLREATAAQPAPLRLAARILGLHQHFTAFDYQRTMSDCSVWDAFVRVVSEAWTAAADDHPPPSLGELAEAWRLMARLFTVLGTPVPRTDLTHSAAAAFCGLPCVLAKMQWGTPYLLTEHGVYLREQYLNLAASIQSYFVRWLLLRLIAAVVDVNYAFADQLSPVCRYNTRWERWRNVESKRLHVIYNGVDPSRFSPAPEGFERHERPLVVNVGLIFPLKGQLDLIEAAALVRKSVPDVEVRLYGSPSDQEYYARCQERISALGLKETVIFAGSTKEPWDAYRRADVVAMASISEGFPYALVEAMLCGAAIVATDVGGVSEALESTGILVTPRDPAELADALIGLLRSEPRRRQLGAAARARALENFTEVQFVDAHRESYRLLADRRADTRPASSLALVRPRPGQRRRPPIDLPDAPRAAGSWRQPAELPRSAEDIQ